ncbi:MAG: PhoH family protein [Planctomycetota bacterium]|nr:PhoH family protein [Planctomycetota bacterium]
MDIHEETIPIDNPDHVRTLFGPQDQFLRLIRDAVGAEIVFRGDELRIQGDADNIQHARAVIAELYEIIQKCGELLPADVHRVLGHESDGSPDAVADAAVDIFERAQQIKALSSGQAEYIRAIRENDLVFCAGPAGSGKTYLAVAMGLQWLRTERVRKIVLVRPAVEAGERLGYLPGDMMAKVNPYLRPLLDALSDMVTFEQVKRYMDNDVIEIVPMAFMRGRTLNETFIILDEGQNTTITQMKMFLTRMGTESKIVVTGDTTQSDLPMHTPSGLTDAVQRLSNIDGVATVRLTGQDIVRHRLVREIVKAYDDDTKPRRSGKQR